MGKGSNTTTQNTTTAPDPGAMAAYRKVMQQADTAAQTPYQAYTGEEVAPINAQQTAGIGDLNAVGGPNSSWLKQIAASGMPITGDTIQQYYSPYLKDVIGATQSDFDVQNRRANSTVTGNAAAAGALGGDRVGVVQALTQEAQNRVQAPIMAGLQNTGYNDAVKYAMADRQRQLQSGVSGEQGALQGAEAEIGAGTLQQQTQQAKDTQGRLDYYQKQGYPFQVAQWMAGIDTGVGSQMGGSSTGQTTAPAPNQTAQYVGMGLTAAAMFSDRRAKENIAKVGKTNDGQPIYRFNYKGDPKTQIGLMHDEVEKSHPEAAGKVGGVGMVDYHKATEDSVERLHGGRVAGFAGGGTPYTGGTFGDQTWVPTNKITPGAGPPKMQAPSPQKPQGGLSGDMMKGLGVLGKDGMNFFQTGDAGISSSDLGSSSSPLPGLDASDYEGYGAGGNQVYGFGGRVKRYATGGQPRGFASDGAVTDDGTFDDRYDAAFPRSTSGVGASVPAFKTRWSDINESPDVDPDKLRASGLGRFEGPPEADDVIPDPGLQKVSPAAVDEWRKRNDADFGGAPSPETISNRGAPAYEGNDSGTGPRMLASRQNAPTQGIGSGSAAIDRAIGSKRPAEAADETSALGYGSDTRSAPPPQQAGFARPPAATAPPPSNTDQSDGQGLLSRLGVHMTPELRQGLLQAGLAMMATTRGGPGSFLGALGEAGMTGVSGYNKTIEAQQKQAEKAREAAIEEENQNLKRAGSPYLLGPDGKPIGINPLPLKVEEEKEKIKEKYSKEKWQLKEGDGLTTPDRLFNTSTGEVKEVAPGKGQAALASMKEGQFDYRVDGPHNLQKGDKLPEPGPTPGHSADELKSDAALYGSNGQLPKASVSPRSEAGRQEMYYQRAVKNYAIAWGLSNGLTPEAMADIRRFGTKAASFPLSRQGDQVVAIGTAIRHLNALEEYAKVWDAAKGDINAPILRQAAAKFAIATNKAEPTNLQEAASIAGPEVIKAIGVQGGGTGGERVAQESRFQPEKGTKQILGAVDVARTFLAGQLPAKEAQARNVGFPHERFLDMVGPKEYDYLNAINHGKTPATAGGTGAAAHPQDAAALKWATEHPDDPRAAAIKKANGQ